MYVVLLVCISTICTAELRDVKVALVISGNFLDVGFNYMLNLARINTEKALNISTTDLFENVDTQDDALALFDTLAQGGYNFIISGSFDHGTAADTMAAKYPNIYWAGKGRRKASIPNLVRLSFDGVTQRYLVGYYAGLMTQTNNVGFVVPGPAVDFDYTINGFYVGVKTANPQCNVYVIKTGTYLNPELATGASKVVLDKGVDVLAGVQDDSTVTEVAIAAGLLGIGNTGFPLSQIYGQKLGIGIVQDWTPMYASLVFSIMNDSWIPFNALEGTFTDNQYQLDEMSFHVPDTVRQKVLTEVQKVKSTPFYFLCGTYVSSVKRANASNPCVTEKEFYQSHQFSDIIDLGNYTIPNTQVTMSKATSVTLISIAGTLAGLLFILMILVFVFRNAVIFAASSYFFLLTMSLGGLMLYIAMILWLLVPTTQLCAARVYMTNLGYTIMIGSLLIKNIRLWIIFARLNKQQWSPTNLKDSKLLMFLIIPIVIHIVLLIVWYSVSGIQMQQIFNVDGIGAHSFMNVCVSKPEGDSVIYAIVVLHVAAIIFGCFLSYKLSKNVDKPDYQEGGSIALILYMLALYLFVMVSLLTEKQTTNGRTLTIVIGILFTTAGTLCILFSPKIINIAKNGINELILQRSDADTTRDDTRSREMSDSFKVLPMADTHLSVPDASPTVQ